MLACYASIVSYLIRIIFAFVTRLSHFQVGSEDIDVIDLNGRDDGILGAGVCDGLPLLFTQKDALVSIVPHKQDIRYDNVMLCFYVAF